MSGGTRSFEMAARLVSMGHEVNMITSWRQEDTKKDWFVTNESGITVYWLPVLYSNQMSYRQRIAAFFKFALMASIKAAQLPADLVYVSSTPLTIALPGVYAARRQKAPLVFEIRDLWPDVPIELGVLRNPLAIKMARWLETFAIKKSQAFVALFDRAKASLLDKGVDGKLVEVIPNGSDLDMFADGNGEELRKFYELSSESILIVYAGTFGRVNGLNYIVDLAHHLADDTRFCFLMIGDGVEKENIVARADACDLVGKNVFFHERVSKSEIVDYLAAADIAISTVSPLKILEADSANKVFDGLAAGKLVAVNYGGILTKILQKSGAGLLLDVNPSIAAKQIQELADQPELLVKHKIAARKLAEDKFSRDKLAIQLEKFLNRTVQNHSLSSNK